MRDAPDVCTEIGSECSLDAIPTKELENVYHWIGLELDERKAGRRPSPRPSSPEGV